MKRITIKDVAAKAGVSYATVSRALTGNSEVSEATRARIQALCRELGYVPNHMARGLVSQKTSTIGVILPDISNPYFSKMALSIERTARELDYRVILTNSNLSEAGALSCAEGLLRLQVDGVIASCVSVASHEQLSALLGSTPAVYIGSNHNDACSFVTCDNQRGGYEGTKYLTTLGHREIVYFGGRDESRTRALRIDGARKAAQEAGADFRELPVSLGGGTGFETDLARRMFREEGVPSAIFAHTDQFAFGVMQAASELGLEAPRDFSLLGFDNLYYARLPRINLTSITPHKSRIGRLAVQHLVRAIAGDDSVYQEFIRPDLIIRNTCGRVKK